MLWQKSWWDTRELFLLNLAVMTFICVLIMGVAMKPDPADYQRTVWVVWFRLVMTIWWPVLALFMGITFLRSFPRFDGPAAAPGLFTLSLPVTRRRIFLSHWAVIMLEMAAISLASAPIISIISRLNGRWFPMKEAFLYSLFIGIGGMAFVSLSSLLIVIFKNNAWAIIGTVVAVNIVLHWPQWLIERYPWWNIYHAMSGESYFHYGEIPWLGLLASLAVSALMGFAATRVYERMDF